MMAGSTKPRKHMKYPPGCGATRNRVGIAIEFARPISEQDDWLSRIKTLNHGAMVAMLAGSATKEDLRDVIAAYNIARSLLLAGFGVEHHDVIIQSADAIEALAKRFTKHGKYILTGQEITALNTLLDLHDAQMSIATVGDIERAIASARAEFESGKCLRLPSKYIGDDAARHQS